MRNSTATLPAEPTNHLRRLLQTPPAAYDEHVVPVGGAVHELERAEILRREDDWREAVAIVELGQGEATERGDSGGGVKSDQYKTGGSVEAAEAVEGEMLHGGTPTEDGIEASGAEPIGGEGEIAEVGAGGGGKAVVSEGAAGAEVEGGEIGAEAGEEEEVVVVEAGEMA